MRTILNYSNETTWCKSEISQMRILLKYNRERKSAPKNNKTKTRKRDNRFEHFSRRFVIVKSSVRKLSFGNSSVIQQSHFGPDDRNPISDFESRNPKSGCIGVRVCIYDVLKIRNRSILIPRLSRIFPVE